MHRVEEHEKILKASLRYFKFSNEENWVVGAMLLRELKKKFGDA